MALAMEHPRRHRFFGRNRPVDAPAAPAGTEARVHPLGAGGAGMWTVLLAAWGGIAVFVGPLFGYHPTSSTAWDWSRPNWLLHAIPGAVGVLAGLMLLGMIGARGVGRRSGISLASLLAMAAGGWFVIGPAAYRMLFSTGNAYSQTMSASDNFLHQVGANLGPGALLLILGGMALKAGIANPRVVYEPLGAVAPAGATAAAPASERPVAERPADGERTVHDGTTRMATTDATDTTTGAGTGTHFAGRSEGTAAADEEPVETGRDSKEL